MADEDEVARLRRRVEELEKEVAELKPSARRFTSLLRSDALSVMVIEAAETRPVAVSTGWERYWQVPPALVLDSDYRLGKDEQLAKLGWKPFLQRSLAGESVLLPLTSYDPQQTEHVKTGRAMKWLRPIQFPVRDETGAVVEVVQLEHDVSDLYALVVQNEALLTEQRTLEGELRERNQALEEQIAFVEAQQRAIHELSVPVIQVWDGVLVLPVVGMVDDARAERIVSGLLEAIMEHGAQQVIIDITGVPALDAAAANALMRAVAASRLVGARCTLSGVSARIAQTIITLDVELGALETCGTLKEALKRALRRREGR